ncbi:MAG: YhcN/YlaJ family sporulation lipoprotein, partial [Tissierellia bacterium]|nr:YhcN/YlaJ family sporulation lipoprotein [Tissierellia bacterium]
MKTKKIYAIAFSLAILVLAVGCTPNNTGLNNNQDRLSTQTRINRDWNLNNEMGVDDLDTRLNDGITNNQNNGINNNLNNGMVRNNKNINNMNNQNAKANKLADEIANIPEVENANVVLNNNSCIVGVDLTNNNNNLTTSLRNRIRNIVKDSTNVSTDNISITTDPDLIERVTSLSEDMANTVG